MPTDKHPLMRKAVSIEMRRKITQMNEARGRCIGSFAQVEYILADFTIKVSSLPGYEAMRSPFPMRFPTRVERVQAIADVNGILVPYRQDLRSMTKAIASWEQKRHFLVHGWMEVEPKSPDVPLFRLRRFEPQKGNDAHQTVMEFDLAQIKGAAKQLSLVANKTMMLFWDIYAEHGLER